jgi:hypothetical protein
MIQNQHFFKLDAAKNGQGNLSYIDVGLVFFVECIGHIIT